MKIKTSELQGAALDWAVEESIGWGHNPNIPAYSTDWALGGPIIEREGIYLFRRCDEHFRPATFWDASLPYDYRNTLRRVISGPTPLIAAMRCYVASKLGDEIEVPDSLLRATA